VDVVVVLTAVVVDTVVTESVVDNIVVVIVELEKKSQPIIEMLIIEAKI